MFYKDKKVLVTGGTGFVGINLIQRLLSLDAHVRATVHKKQPIVCDDRIEYVQCNLLKLNDCQRVVKDIDYVFMCAANTSGAAVIAATPLVHVTPNIIMNSQLLESSYFAEVKKFIFLSSSVVYPPSGEKPVKESDMLLDCDPYDTYFGAAWMKRYTEILCRLYSKKLKKTMPTVVVRPSNIYGPYDDFDFNTSHVMAATIRKVIERQNPIQVWGTGDDVRDFIYVDDFIDALTLVAEKVDTYDPINIASGKEYSVKQVLEIASEIDNYKDITIICDPSKPSMIPIRIFDTRKAQQLIGFKTKTDIRDGISKTIKWYKNYVLTV